MCTVYSFIHLLCASTVAGTGKTMVKETLYICFPCGSDGKESACNEGELASILGLWRSTGGGKGYPLQYSGLGEFHGLYSPWGRKESDMTELLSLPSCSAHKEPACTWVWVGSRSWWWTGRPGMLWFMGLQRVRHDWVTELTDFKYILPFFSGLQSFCWKISRYAYGVYLLCYLLILPCCF